MKNTTLQLSAVAQSINGNMHGADIQVNGLSVPEAQQEGSICIISNEKNIPLMNGIAAAYIVDEKFKVNTDKPYITVKNTRVALVHILSALAEKTTIVRNIAKFTAIDESATVAEVVDIANFVEIGAKSVIAGNTRIHANVTIGKNVQIGENCIIYPNVTIYDNCVIGNNVILQAGVVIGGDGFGFIPGENPTKIPHIGRVVIEDFVEIGANTTIDRATIGDTVISFGTKLDNLIAIGHNVTVGKACLFASQVGISGSSKVEDNVILAGQVGISDHVTISSGVVLGGQSGVSNDVKEKGLYMGSPCMPFMKFAKSQAVFAELPELKKRVREIEKQSN